MPPKDKYANPELRDQIKKEIHESDKGGAPGQWSARKAQMMAKEYKDKGGEYNTDPKDKDESQKNLSNWTKEEWQTKEGSGHAKKEDGTEKRYLPKKAWEQMSEKEKEETDEKKQEGSKEGKQHVSNTPKAKSKGREAREETGKVNGKTNDQDDENNDDDQEETIEDDEEGDEEAEDDSDFEQDDTQDDDGGDEDEEEGEGEGEEDQDEQATNAGDKRKAKNQSNGSAKKQKQGNAPAGKVGSKHMNDKEPAPSGSADRLPKKGQKITWKAMPGFVDGKVTEILTQGKTVDGKSVKASKDDPKIVMESSSSGKICVHKPDACFYD